MNRKTDPLPTDSQERKTYPVYTGFLKYFPKAVCTVAKLSYEGNKKHNAGQPVHWARDKSDDHEDCLGRHLIEGEYEAVAWRAMALLETKLEEGYIPKFVLRSEIPNLNPDKVYYKWGNWTYEYKDGEMFVVSKDDGHTIEGGLGKSSTELILKEGTKL